MQAQRMLRTLGRYSTHMPASNINVRLVSLWPMSSRTSASIPEGKSVSRRAFELLAKPSWKVVGTVGTVDTGQGKERQRDVRKDQEVA